jgi:hypothetical protein
VYDVYGREECDDVMPFVQRIFWLSSVREALGWIPNNFDLSYEEVLGLVWLQQESNKKLQYDNWKMSQESKAAHARTKR